MSRILALDVGEKRIGVAVSDTLNIIAQGLKTIKRISTKDTIAKIQSLIKEYDVSKIIVGMPFNMDGSKGPAVKKVEGFIELLKKEMAVSIETIDERLTTAQGERVLLEADVSRRKRKLSLDRLAAQIILQAYLDSRCTKK